MKTVNVTEFKTHCLRLLEEAQRTGEAIELVKRGRSIATVLPRLDAGRVSYEPGQFKDEIRIVGDLDDLDVRWEALE